MNKMLLDSHKLYHGSMKDVPIGIEVDAKMHERSIFAFVLRSADCRAVPPAIKKGQPPTGLTLCNPWNYLPK